MQQLIAEEGKVYTDGEIYGREICLPDSVDASVFRQVEESEMPKENPMKYSARSILRELRELGKYESFRQLLTRTGYDWEFLSANYLADDDADFARLKIAVVDAGIVGSKMELDALLEKCVWSPD